jgi:hypothetical protein
MIKWSEREEEQGGRRKQSREESRAAESEEAKSSHVGWFFCARRQIVWERSESFCVGRQSAAVTARVVRRSGWTEKQAEHSEQR